MAGINSAQVYLPTPDQTATVGAVATAPIGTAAPSDARTALPAAWESGGYIGEDGLSMSISKSLTAIKDWSLSVVRKALTEYDGTLSFPFMQADEFAMNETFGDDNVTATAANTQHGSILNVGIGANLPEAKSWCFSMKDENRRVRIYVPNGQITEVGEVSFVPGSAHQYPVTLSTYDDGTGHSIYVIYDDGVVSA